MNESSKISPSNTKTDFGRYDKGHKNGYVIVMEVPVIYGDLCSEELSKPTRG